MLTIYLEKNYNISLNSNKSKSRTIINYIKITLILYLIDVCVLINILITKKNKILFANLYFVYIKFMRN